MGLCKKTEVSHQFFEAQARVQFLSSYDADLAIRNLQGRYIYDGCCRMEISLVDEEVNQLTDDGEIVEVSSIETQNTARTIAPVEDIKLLTEFFHEDLVVADLRVNKSGIDSHLLNFHYDPISQVQPRISISDVSSDLIHNNKPLSNISDASLLINDRKYKKFMDECDAYVLFDKILQLEALIKLVEMNAQPLLKYEEISNKNCVYKDGIESRLGASIVIKDFLLLFDPGGKLCILIIAFQTSFEIMVLFTVSLASLQQHTSKANNRNQIIMNENCPGKDTEQAFKTILRFTSILSLKFSDGAGKITNLDYGKLRVNDADSVEIIIVASSSLAGPFVKPADSKKYPNRESLTVMNSVKPLSYFDLHTRHLSDYQKLFHHVYLQIWKNESCDFEDEVSSVVRVRSSRNDNDLYLIEVLFQYGRYLLISSSRPGTQVTNFQGIWSKDVYPPWEAAPHLNINLQMSYWPKLSCNLQESQELLFDYISLSINAQKSATVNYEASGWVAHQVSDIWAKTSMDRGEAVWALWLKSGACITTHLCEDYTFTIEKEFILLFVSLVFDPGGTPLQSLY